MAATKSAPARSGSPPPAGGARAKKSTSRRAVEKGASTKGGLRKKASAAASVAAPEAAPFIALGNEVHGKVAGARHHLPSGSGHRLLLLEYLVCVTVLGLGTIVAPTGSKDGVPRLMSRGTGLSLLFFVLALTASAGDGAKRAANGLGGLVTIAYLVTSSDAHEVAKWIAGYFSTTGVKTAAAGAAGGAAAGSGTGASGAGEGLGSLGTTGAASGPATGGAGGAAGGSGAGAAAGGAAGAAAGE